MDAIYFTLAAVALYLVSDWIVNRIETAYGRRFENRTLLFFAILLLLALTSFALIQRLTA